MNSQPSNAYHMDGRFNGSHNNGFYGIGSSGSQRFYQPGLAPGVPVTSGISTTPSCNMVYKLSPQEEVKKRLVQGHLSYLNRDETPEKLAHKTKLESLILEYLSMVPHCNKFDNIEVAECFDKSIYENKNFTAPRAASAFEVLEKYATSLLTKPWRKEFRTILPYGGYMKGLVDKQLRGASKILYLMGYRNKSINGVVCYSAESSIIDPDTLARVSLDCLIAFVECQMMIEIADTLKKNISLSWLQILDIRANSICSMDQLINYVLDSDRLIDLETDPSLSLHSSKYGKQSHPIGQNKRLPGQVQSPQYHQNGCPVLRENRRTNDLPPPKEIINHQNLDNSRSRDLMNFTVENESRNPNVIYHGIHTPTGYIAPPPMFASEFSNSYAANHQTFNSNNYPPYLHHHHQQNQQQQQPVSSSTPLQSIATNNKSNHNHNDSGLNKNSVDTIDGTLSTLNIKSSGSRLKNVDRRTPTSTTSRTPCSSSTVISSHGTSRSDESNQLSDCNLTNNNSSHVTNNTTNNNNAANKRLEDRINAILKSFSDEDKSRKSVPPNPEPKERKSIERLPERKPESMLNQHRINKNRDKSHDRSAGITKSNQSDKNGWPCAYCTFLNTNQTEICDMCSRSRDKPEANLLSGGRVCPVCTLVNSKDATSCSACEHSLLNSPTYI
ncbi:LOW QUALITY PROTEIN: protein tamozhennic-like [Panonychus citri]|uniref:LOW QUALITY PROTEIN: protein tamozhennic-like n=1 Tax=Panonychus citri TaxID=50023 RepID=UPI002307BCF9|nr:LOW QUALITY PROTEIN: protein tamozhennic-like [Panonychus citri]